MAVSTREMHWDVGSKTFTADASTLAGGGRAVPFARTPSGLGLDVESHRTGLTVRFVVVGTARDLEGDVTSWELRPAADALRSKGIRMVIFND